MTQKFGSIREYLNNLSEVRSVLKWINKEVVSQESRKHLRNMLLVYLITIFFMSIQPAAIGLIFGGLTEQSGNLIILGLVAVTACLVIQKITDTKMAKAREYALGIHWRNLDKRLTELFFEKSAGQIIQESALSVSTIDKGRWKLLDLQGMIFFEGIPVVIQLLISLILLFVFSIYSGLIMVSAISVYVAYSIYLNFHVMRVCVPIDKSFRQLNKRRIERLEKAIRVKISSQEEREVEEMTEWFDMDLERDRNFWLWFIERANWRGIINTILLVSILSYGAWLVWEGEWNIGMLYPLYAWSSRVSENLWRLGSIEHQINWNLPSVQSMIEALSLEPDIIDPHGAVDINGNGPLEIRFEEVSHIYPKTEKVDDTYGQDEGDDREINEEVDNPHALKKISFSIETGEKVALLGPTGAGKTTVMRLLLRFMDPTSGRITVGGHDLRQVSRGSWIRSLGYIAQHPEVFDGTIRENLTYRLPKEKRLKVSDEELWSLMRMLEIDFGTRLTHGLDTRVGKHGLKLSGGQAQRLMIGAAVIGKPWLMVIDEATSSLDSTTERKVQQGLSKILSGNTSALIVAHRLSTVRYLCTKFVMLKSSEEINNGSSQVEAIASSFEELYRVSPTFRMLADDQEIKIV